MIVPTRHFYRRSIKQQTVATSNGPLAALAIKAVQAPFSPGLDTDSTLLTLATFDGYATITGPSNSAGNWGHYDGVDGFQYDIAFASIVWKFTAPVVVGNVIYGLVFDDAVGGLTVASCRFDAPKPMQVETDSIWFKLRFAFRSHLDIGDVILLD